ncbi:MAG: response regulator transcription factor [Cyclobacteriaceae bacterium]|nr:response regulator transcription factor [Cyclobacteriaceae bacterium]
MEPGVLVVDDHVMTCDGIAALVEKQCPVKSYTAYGAERALEILKQTRIQVAMIDARMPGISGVELMHRLKKESPSLKLIGMTSFDEDETILDLLRTGIPGIILKRNTTGAEIKTCLEAVLAGKSYYTAEIWNRFNQGGYDLLKEKIRFSKREFDLLLLLAQGYSTKQAAEVLKLSENTVEDYRKQMLKKSNTKNTTELVAFVLSNGLLLR